MKELYGKFEYDNNNFAFAYKDYIITIISSGYEYANILYDKECDDVLLGITTNNNYNKIKLTQLLKIRAKWVF